MKEKDFKSVLEMREISLTAIAARMYPENNRESARTRLSNKINNKAGQRLTNEDLKKGEGVLKKLADDIYSKLSPNPNEQDRQA